MELPKYHETFIPILEILNHIIYYGVYLNTFEATAKELGISETTFRNLLQFLIKNKFIALGFRFRFIGAGSEYSFLIENTQNDPSLKEKVEQFLYQHPFSYIYHGDNIIAGRCQVPDTWIKNIFEFFTKLQININNLRMRENKSGDENKASSLLVHLYLGQRILGYHHFNPNIHLPKNYIYNEFGHPSKQEIDLKT